MFRENERSGVLVSGELREHVRIIAKLTEKAGGWRNFYTDDPSDTMQVMFIGSRLRDTSLGALENIPASIEERTEKWGDMPKEEIDRDDLLEIYHGTMEDGLVCCYPMIRFRVTPDDKYYLLDYETDFDEHSEKVILIEDQALPVAEKWIEKMVGIHCLLWDKE